MLPHAVAQRVDQQREGRRGLAPARDSRDDSPNRGAPVLEHPLEPALREVRQRQVLRHVGEAEARQRGVEHLDGAVEDELAVDAHLSSRPPFSNSQA